MVRKYTHAKGFNVTSLDGVSGLYLFLNEKGEVVYIGKCDGNFKGRINSHDYGEHGKLTPDIKYIIVIIADKNIYPLHVLEHLFIWCFLPQKNDDLWLFHGNDEGKIIQAAKEKELIINGSVKEFMLSFESVLIEREWENESTYKRYGQQEQLFSKKVHCTGSPNCLCFNCTLNRETVRWHE